MESKEFIYANDLDLILKKYNDEASINRIKVATDLICHFFGKVSIKETISDATNRLYDEIGKEQADMVIDMMCDGCRESINGIKAGMLSVGTPKIGDAAYVTYRKSQQSMMEEISNCMLSLAALPSTNDEIIHNTLGVNLALYFMSMVSKYDDLGYDGIYAIEKGVRGEVATDMFQNARDGLNYALSELTKVKKQHSAVPVGKKFKEYLSSDEFLGSKRKSLKR